MSILNTSQIMEILPHRHPFLLIDTVEELEVGVRAVAKKRKTAYFAGINSAKFKQKVLPGDTLMLETEIIKVKGPIGVGKATAYVDGKVVCMAELTFAIG